jgi:hypothetical protein
MERRALGKEVVVSKRVLVTLWGRSLRRGSNEVGASTLVGGLVYLGCNFAVGKNSLFDERRPKGIELVMIPIVQVGVQSRSLELEKIVQCGAKGFVEEGSVGLPCLAVFPVSLGVGRKKGFESVVQSLERSLGCLI